MTRLALEPQDLGLHLFDDDDHGERRGGAAAAITAKGRVAEVDVKDTGDFVLYQAAHGTVPVNIPRTPR